MSAPEAGPSGRSRLRILLRIAYWATALGFIACIAAAFTAWLVFEHVTRPGVPGREVAITIPEGSTGQEAGRVLARGGLVEQELFFRLAIRLDKRGGTIKQGEYLLPMGLSPTQLLHALYAGPNRALDSKGVPDDLRITVPEGLSIPQMASRMTSPVAFLEAARDPALVARLGIGADSLEGFLMPNTYFFAAKPVERQVVERMVEQFQREYAALAQSDTPEDMLRIVTIASLIEEEARVDEERPLVSAVIRNRLEKGMRLDMDSTLQFALDKYGQRLLDEDKEMDSPYNTYRVAGLPPGPICSPGVESLRAALSPAAVEYLYFVSNADGKTHTFSRTLDEHNAAVAKFRREIRTQRNQRDAAPR